VSPQVRNEDQELARVKRRFELGWGKNPRLRRMQGWIMLLASGVGLASIACIYVLTLVTVHHVDLRGFLIFMLFLVVPLAAGASWGIYQIIQANKAENEMTTSVRGYCKRIEIYANWCVFVLIDESGGGKKWYVLEPDFKAVLSATQQLRLTISPSTGWVSKVEIISQHKR
jgi:hypothetical protein